jgi:anti-anti-sigma regulatory factor
MDDCCDDGQPANFRAEYDLGRSGCIGVRLAGRLDLSAVDVLAACADRLCTMPASMIRLDLRGLTAVDGAGARTLAAACHCLRLHHRQVVVAGLRAPVQAVLAALGVELDAPVHGTRPGGVAGTAADRPAVSSIGE